MVSKKLCALFLLVSCSAFADLSISLDFNLPDGTLLHSNRLAQTQDTVYDATQSFLTSLPNYRDPVFKDHHYDSLLGVASSQTIQSSGAVRYYGWCYEVNDVMPNQSADQVTLHEGDQISWFYGFSEKTSSGWTTCQH